MDINISTIFQHSEIETIAWLCAQRVCRLPFSARISIIIDNNGIVAHKMQIECSLKMVWSLLHAFKLTIKCLPSRLRYQINLNKKAIMMSNTIADLTKDIVRCHRLSYWNEEFLWKNLRGARSFKEYPLFGKCDLVNQKNGF